MNLFEEIHLPNGLVVEMWNNSRSISDDTTQVKLIVKTKVEVKKEYFDEQKHYEDVVKVFGSEIFFEYQKERTFVSTGDKDNVFSELLDDFKRDTIPYMARPSFPARFALSKYDEIHKKFYKYRHLLR